MTHRLIRIIALFLLAVYLPTSAMGAAPMVWCVGDDGHSSIEIKAFEGTHGTHASLARDIPHFDLAARELHPIGCIDRTIAVKNIAPVAGSQTLASNAKAPPKPFIVATTTYSPNCDTKRPPSLADAYHLTPHLRHLKTIILLN